jgi:hypothetical protein
VDAERREDEGATQRGDHDDADQVQSDSGSGHSCERKATRAEYHRVGWRCDRQHEGTARGDGSRHDEHERLHAQAGGQAGPAARPFLLTPPCLTIPILGRCARTLLFLFLGGTANATVVLGPTDVQGTSPDSNSGFGVDALINQSGLSANYTSGVTDFSAFTSTTRANYRAYGGSLFTNVAGIGGLGSFYLDLGNVFSVSAGATWGQDGGTATMTAYDLFYSDTFGSAGSRTLVGRFSAGVSPNAFAHTFSAVNARYFELDVVSNGGFGGTRVNELVFGGQAVAAVPEPSTLALFGIGLFGMGLARRKKV